MSASELRTSLVQVAEETKDGQTRRTYGGVGFLAHRDGDMFIIVTADNDALQRLIAGLGWTEPIDWSMVTPCKVGAP